MDFDSSLFDLPFEDLASLSVDTQQQQFTATAGPLVDFQDFCSDFASGDFASSDFPSGDLGAEVSDTTASSWNFDLLPAVSPTHIDVPAVRALKDENSFKDGKDAFDTLGPCDSFQEMFNYNMGSDTQVGPDMTPGEANAADFTLPTFSQSYVVPKSTTASQGLPTKPYSWMNGMDYASFGWPARTRLPSDPAARQQSLERYRDKKARRFNNSTKVRYEMRKVNADKRPRIKGRFVKPEELQTYLRSMPEDLS